MRILIISLILVSAPAFAKTKTKLGTDFKFDPHSVRGSYQTSDQAVATVENEKTLNRMLQPRKNFKDRIKNEMKLEQAGNKELSKKKER